MNSGLVFSLITCIVCLAKKPWFIINKLCHRTPQYWRVLRPTLGRLYCLNWALVSVFGFERFPGKSYHRLSLNNRCATTKAELSGDVMKNQKDSSLKQTT
ncbi:hypothetical protein QVD17_01482 [Tagetes erecta]|uniref:Uncharacterized protein n=1 Tax=Tagetes erecta TaxID=13708 RepID=A0AAD8LDK5_TARER|nr:hypothetical protein QVD17_01482 [Tagetes erecta]